MFSCCGVQYFWWPCFGWSKDAVHRGQVRTSACVLPVSASVWRRARAASRAWGRERGSRARRAGSLARSPARTEHRDGAPALRFGLSLPTARSGAAAERHVRFLAFRRRVPRPHPPRRGGKRLRGVYEGEAMRKHSFVPALIVLAVAAWAASSASAISSPQTFSLLEVVSPKNERPLGDFTFDRPPVAGDQFSVTNALYRWAGAREGHGSVAWRSCTPS